MIPGRATPTATQPFTEHRPHAYRITSEGLALSMIGLGTGRHEASELVDQSYRATVEGALLAGCNVIDTAINYRHQRSERLIGSVLSGMINAGTLRRESVVVATKGGYVPFDQDEPAEPSKYIYETYINSGIAHANEFCADYRHCLAPNFLECMIEQSRFNLNLETLDIYYLHNPETQRITLSRDTFRRRMLDAFETLEHAVEKGWIAHYGLATWTGCRVPPNAPDYLSLAELVGLAYEVAGESHHLRYVQMPYNLLMPEAFALENQQLDDQFMSAIQVSEALGLTVMISASIYQGRLTVPIVPDLEERLTGLTSDTQRAIQFVRSTPGVTVALTGTHNPEHLAENLAILTVPAAEESVILALFGRG
jgi:aryl-alcohol dehydrogenase-like predicted oxidoreductase